MNNTFKVFRQINKDSAAAEAGEHLNQLLLENKKNPVLLVLSAGSSFAVLDYVGKNALGDNLHICLLDERFSQDPAINSFSQLQKTEFYVDALNAEANFFGTLPRPNETKEDMAARWEKYLKTWREQNPMGLIVATLGMGADGHTGGVLPFPEDANEFHRLFESEAWVRAYDAGDKNKYRDRDALTLTFLRQINIGFGFVCGADKKPKLDEVIKNQGKVHELPALAWHDIADVKVFTDIE
ncbi:MAG TPA: 6-phosphogluconolactonase [Candidatus Limnocylindria bacterium]|nr:6-phosphogluconolactonase [Candidatus Limnocylindria bacterium]